ncbi:MAG: glycoside hydrolase family 5 protein [Treponema sp.]|jgi:endoglucanase|nr:glycoside hydrolase family 5 protein [Treponema sp.]
MKKLFGLLLICFLITAFSGCPEEPEGESMREIAAIKFVKDMGIGYNIGNNLDSWNGETAWGNVLINQGYIKALKNYGYKTVRIPVTWADNLGSAPDYTINKLWLDRVQEVVDWCLAEKLYVIINIHHDGHGNSKSWIQNAAKDYPDNNANVLAVANQLAAVWKQIASRFSGYSDYLIFEGMNEIGFDTIWNRYAGGQTAQKTEAYRILNVLNQKFVDTVRSFSGNNKSRFLLIPGYWTDIDNTCDPFFKMPKDSAKDRMIISVHYYTPWNFAGAGTSATWGSDSERNQLNNLFNKMKINFIDKEIPVILGEYNVINNKLPNMENRVNWLLAVTQKCIDLGICPILWCNGYDENNNRFHDMGDIRRTSPYTMSDTLKDVWKKLKFP